MNRPPDTAYEYADGAFRDCDLNDHRLTRRVVRSIACLTERPDDPASTVFTRRAERVAFGRLLHNPRMVPAVLHEALAHDAFTHAAGQPMPAAAARAGAEPGMAPGWSLPMLRGLSRTFA